VLNTTAHEPAHHTPETTTYQHQPARAPNRAVATTYLFLLAQASTCQARLANRFSAKPLHHAQDDTLCQPAHHLTHKHSTGTGTVTLEQMVTKE